jgi:hypothetical protein
LELAVEQTPPARGNDDGALPQQEQEFEFRLFADAPAKESSAAVPGQKVVLVPEQDDVGVDGGFVVPQRPLSFYIPGRPSADELAKYAAAAVGGKEVLAKSGAKCWGLEVPWRVKTRIRLTKREIGALLATTHELAVERKGQRKGLAENGSSGSEDERPEKRKRTRPCKRTRIARRKKAKAAEEKKAHREKEQADKESRLREKKTRLNRERKVKRLQKKKELKAAAAAATSAIQAVDVGTEVVQAGTISPERSLAEVP